MESSVSVPRSSLSPMPKMKFHHHIIAYISLGLLCGIYYLALILYPTLIYFSYRASFALTSPPTIVLILLLFITLVPINHKPQYWFLRSGIWKIWHQYFDYEVDATSVEGKISLDEKYLFWEAPHGIWPMGQFLSCLHIPKLTGVSWEEKMICGTGADMVFMFPFVRHVMSWLGTHTASRKSFSKIFKTYGWGAVIAGGIAEMFLGTSSQEGIFIKKRRNTVKMAIQEGAHIIPGFFFGNSRIFHVVGGETGDGKDTSYIAKLLQKLSRTLKASIVIFYGRHFLPVPLRTPLKMCTGNVIRVKQNPDPSDEYIQEVLDQVIAEMKRIYASDKKPAWETRPLVIN